MALVPMIIKWAANFFFKTKTGIIILVAGALTVYHFSEVRGAVKNALSNAADEALIASQRQTISLLNAKIVANEKILEQFEKSADQADEIANNAKLELERYEKGTNVNIKCAVDDAVLNRLSNK